MVNGRKVVDSWQPNRGAWRERCKRSLRASLHRRGDTGEQVLHFYVDDATINTLGNNAPTSGICALRNPT